MWGCFNHNASRQTVVCSYVTTISRNVSLFIAGEEPAQILCVMLRATIKSNSYTPTGSVMFTYSVAGSPDEIKAFHDAQDKSGMAKRGKSFWVTDEAGVPLWNTFRFHGDNTELSVTNNGNVVANDLDRVIAEQDEANRLERQEFAKIAAQARYDRQFGGVRALRSVNAVVPGESRNAAEAGATGAAPGAVNLNKK